MRRPVPALLRSPARAAALLAAAVLTLSACSSGPGGDATSADTKAQGNRYGDCTVSGKRGELKLKTVTPGTLTVAGDLPSAGWWNGNTVADIKSGFEYCLAAEIAHRAGLDTLTIRNVSFDAMVAGKAQGYDLALAEVSITDARRKVVDFSTPYFDSNIGVLAKPGSVTAANIRGLRLGVKQATSGAAFVKDELKPEKPVSVFPGDPEMLAALQSGRIDAALTDTAILLGQAAKSKGAFSVVGQYATGESYGAILPKNGPDTAALDGVLAALKSDGTLDRLSREHLAKAFGGDPATLPVWSL
ncbi:ABC transporter substrate-binding protein [Streptomyces sp. NPDC094032]|uniref:ABC transporter substrate-binding protein n=1 Tax=Streptomyces sp. NPDC094032 TaxID=3155308 RepID=UPI00332133A3